MKIWPIVHISKKNMTNNKDLKTINIKGKEYIPVSERIKAFNADYPEGSITTELISDPSSNTIIIKATVKPTPGRTFTGYSQAVVGDGYINKTSALENAETSAVGRALGMMGIGVIDSVASADEIKKATSSVANTTSQDLPDPTDDWVEKEPSASKDYCGLHKSKMIYRGPNNYDHRAQLGADMKLDPNGSWHICRGHGWHLSETK